MTQKDHKQEKKTEQKKVPTVAEETDVYFFNPWDEQFKVKPQYQDFEF